MNNYQGMNYSKKYTVVKNLSTIIENRNYSYRLIKSNFIHCNGDMIQAYGIEVETTEINNDEITGIERAGIEYISPYMHKVYALLSKLHSNNVSPIHLVDVIGEYVDDYTYDFDGFNLSRVSNDN